MVKWMSAVIVAAVTALALAGCGGGGDTSSYEAVPAQDMVVDKPDREIIRNADMSLRVDDVRGATSQVAAVAEAADGRVASESINSTGEALYANLTLRVPSDRLDSVIAEISGLGEVTSLSVVADDVTAQGADLDARISALQTSVTRLRQLLAQATTTKDLIEVEGELTERQAELDALLAQRAVLSDAVAMSTLNVYISPSSEAAQWTPPGFLSGLQSGWNALRTLVAGLITMAGFLLPFVAVAVAVAAPVIVVIWALRRRRR